MPTYINMPTFNINENNIQSSTIKYTNSSKPDVQNVKQMLDDLYSTKVETVPGKGLSTNDFTDAYKEKIDSIKDQIYFSTYLEFPNVGEEDILYIDKENNVSYLWDDTNKIYKSITFDQNDYIIQSVL